MSPEPSHAVDWCLAQRHNLLISRRARPGPRFSLPMTYHTAPDDAGTRVARASPARVPGDRHPDTVRNLRAPILTNSATQLHVIAHMQHGTDTFDITENHTRSPCSMHYDLLINK